MSVNDPKAGITKWANPVDVTDNDVDEGIRLMSQKERELSEAELKYLNQVRRGKLIKALMFVAISQLPFMIYMILNYMGA